MVNHPIFVDTNVIIDLIADRKPFSKFAIALFNAAEHGKIALYTSSHSIATTQYLLKKYITEKELRMILIQILDFLEVIAVDTNNLRKSLRSGHKDFEDAIQIYCAAQIKNMRCIVTRNIKDFKASEIPAITPDNFYDQYLMEK